MISEKDQKKMDKVNKVSPFSASWDSQGGEMIILCRNVELNSLTGDIPILTRQLGYDIPIQCLLKTGLEFMSAESTPGKQNDPNGVYHEHYYCIIKAIDNNKVRARVKYFDSPEDITDQSLDAYLNLIKNRVRKGEHLNMVNKPYGFELNDMKLVPKGFRMRPNVHGSFYFETELEGESYGDILLQIDQIIHKIER